MFVFPLSLHRCVVSSLLLLLAMGCAPRQGEARLRDGYKLLDSPRPDYVAMSAAADAYLAEKPTGPGAGEALYLRGRAFEEKSQRDITSPERDLAQAHAAYQQALAQSPRPAVEGLIHAGIGNVLYFQNRYAPAVTELTAALPKLEREDDKAWATYRIGLCQQRSGQWESADQTFAKVRQLFPGTEQARRAAEHQGARGYYVQVGAYAAAAQADAAVADLKKQGLTVGKFADSSKPGVQLVRVGPLASYAAAVGVKERVWKTYSGAMIVP